MPADMRAQARASATALKMMGADLSPTYRRTLSHAILYPRGAGPLGELSNLAWLAAFPQESALLLSLQ